MKYLNKRGVLGDLENLVRSLASFAILLVIVFLIIAQIKSNAIVTADANSTAAITQIQNSMATIPGWLPIIVITVIGGVLLMLVSYFRGK